MRSSCCEAGFLLMMLVGQASAGPQESVESIMARVAENQDRAQQLRSAFVYNQDLLVRFFKGNGKLAREEIREYAVTPGPKNTVKTLRRFHGRYEKDGRYVEYTDPGYHHKDMDIDGDVMEGIADDLADEQHSRDGISVNLFPLTSAEQKGYRFALEDRQEYRGKEVYRICFKPVEQNWDDAPWAGQILVDSREYQPVLVTTQLAGGIPFLVRTLLGTNIKGLGFKISYERFDEGLWFPVTYGGEFELRAVFFYKRKMAIALRNSGFQHVRVDTRVTYENPSEPAPPPFP